MIATHSLIERVAAITGKSSFVSPDEKYVGFVRDFAGVMEPVHSNHWTILFKQSFIFEDETRAFIRLHIEVPSSIANEQDITVFRNSFKLRVVNNDTLEEVLISLVLLYPS